jgi:hypothetical protein
MDSAGEGAERTPLGIVSDVPFVTFLDRDPNNTELSAMSVTPGNDLFAPSCRQLPDSVAEAAATVSSAVAEVSLRSGHRRKAHEARSLARVREHGGAAGDLNPCRRAGRRPV